MITPRIRPTPYRRLAWIALAASLALPAAAQDQRPFAELPYTPVLDLQALDRSIDPCQDLYQFSCGGWQQRNPIPPDRGSWSVYAKTADENLQFLWGLLVSAAAPDPARTSDQAQIGDAFAACIDQPAVEARGAAPLADDLASVRALTERAQLARWLGARQRQSSGSLLFGFGSAQDLDDSESVIAWATAGGLGLPDRDYYLKRDKKSRETLARYRAHVARMLTLAGDASDAAAAGADGVLRVETALARASLTNVEARDARNLKHKMSLAELAALTPSLDWNEYLAGLGIPAPAVLNVTEPRFFRAVERLVRRGKLADLRAYFRWHIVSERAESLSSPFVQADFEFYGAYLMGAKALPPRWKRCVEWVDDNLGEALGRVFVERTFTPEMKSATADMVARIEAAMDRRIRALPWMSPATQAKALEKLAAMRNKIGYPEHFRDYSKLRIERDDFAGNTQRAEAFETGRQLAKIGHPVDRGEWSMTPPTVNAYYDSANNDMNFPAGVLLPPLFDPRLDAAPNYGNTGGTVGHELTHGFDDDGRHFDAHGNLVDWWTPADAAEFERRAACVVEQYGAYTVVDDLKVNSRLTLGEDLADLGGLILAWEAWRELTSTQRLAPVDGFTPEQRFFIGFAQWDCANDSPEALRLRALTNPHSPAKYRINGVVVNMPEFGAAFACKAGSPMVKDQAAICRVW